MTLIIIAQVVTAISVGRASKLTHSENPKYPFSKEPRNDEGPFFYTTIYKRVLIRHAPNNARLDIEIN